ncbi:hypothetical protein CPJCM30710_07450 [Clostridium polyendosporum]|uniref:Uncharacterized protein n=1 Tax=Clostridium polyendosporum TaxID=69208 RepID=A0A919VDJ5_9CLOT|nr:hypothetical protein [Clostridium polyendosporum]GIM28079.1 hypothetical protein CPJCM30710_07450 [Clostridium polyendosporum]
MNCYDAMKRILEIDVRMQELGDLLSNAKDSAEKMKYEDMIDALEIEFLKLRNALKHTEININFAK